MAEADAGEVLITTASFGSMSPEPWKALQAERLRSRRPRHPHPLTAEQLAEEVGAADALIVGLDAVNEVVFEAATNLRAVAKHGVGTDNIDLAAAERAGVTVVNAPGTNTTAVAELTWALILAGARRIAAGDAAVRRGQWPTVAGIELAGRTLGLVGFGRIGRAVCRRGLAFEMDVIAYDPFATPQSIIDDGARPVRLEECVASADILCLHAPWTPGQPPLLDRRLIGSMRAGAGVVNTARGGLVDEMALAEALRDGRVGFASVDALGEEPPPADHPLLSAPNTLVTPHIGAMTDGANAAMGVAVVRDVARVLRYEAPLQRVSASNS